MKYYLWFALLLAFSSLSAESWTVLVYMAADNNLAQQGRLDLNSMESVAQPAGLNLIVQADFPEGAYRYRITQDNSTAITSPVLSNLGTIDSGNPYTLNNFLRWGYESFPSDRTMLVIWSHGDSWYKNEGKWICPDDSAENLISISEGDLAKAFVSIPKLDVLLFDACSMQGIEVLGEVHSYANYLIGSADLVPVNGFPYETIIPLFEGTIDSILQQIPLLYVESYYP
ncbi:MAG: clostripain-related cysteine peptidase, partial [Candidatus Cloacimonetes bacterium]|nr:clostripain-related cysteine peptidase [Candidatus Cloacimonadota bacterium]